MPTATLSTRVDQWLYGKLVAGVTAVSGRVHGDGAAPAGTVLPFVDFALLSSLIVGGLNGTRIVGRLVYLVEVVATADGYTPLEAGSDQLYTTLHQHPRDSSVAGLVISSCICEEEVRRVGVGDDRDTRYLGWRVRIEAEAT